MLTKIRDGWWVDLTQILFFKIIDTDPSCFMAEIYYKHIKQNEFFQIENQEDAKLFEKALKMYVYGYEEDE